MTTSYLDKEVRFRRCSIETTSCWLSSRKWWHVYHITWPMQPRMQTVSLASSSPSITIFPSSKLQISVSSLIYRNSSRICISREGLLRREVVQELHALLSVVHSWIAEQLDGDNRAQHPACSTWHYLSPCTFELPHRMPRSYYIATIVGDIWKGQYFPYGTGLHTLDPAAISVLIGLPNSL